MMTRAEARDIAVMLCYATATSEDKGAELTDIFFDEAYYKTLEIEGMEVFPNEKLREYIKGVVFGVNEKMSELDAHITKYSKGWKTSRISKTALTILRVAIYETLYVSDVPENVAISEAIEIAKGYEEKETVSFINGVLGSFARGDKTFEIVEEEKEQDEIVSSLISEMQAPTSEESEEVVAEISAPIAEEIEETISETPVCAIDENIEEISDVISE